MNGPATWQVIRQKDGRYRSPESLSFVPRDLVPNGRGALLVAWWERDSDLNFALATVDQPGVSRVFPIGHDAIGMEWNYISAVHLDDPVFQ
jgi:hypothetical protein